MDDKDEQIAARNKLIVDFGNAAASLIEQQTKCKFIDELGHSLFNNAAFIALGNALQAASSYAASQNEGPSEEAAHLEELERGYAQDRI